MSTEERFRSIPDAIGVGHVECPCGAGTKLYQPSGSTQYLASIQMRCPACGGEIELLPEDTR